MTTNPVNRFTYKGRCLGGPWKERWLVSHGDPVYRLARMKKISVNDVAKWDALIDWAEDSRGQYEWDSGIWWWKGWG